MSTALYSLIRVRRDPPNKVTTECLLVGTNRLIMRDVARLLSAEASHVDCFVAAETDTATVVAAYRQGVLINPDEALR